MSKRPGRRRGSPAEFFTNWNEYEGPLGKKLRLTLRNRWLTIASLKGCCGHPREPGCLQVEHEEPGRAPEKDQD